MTGPLLSLAAGIDVAGYENNLVTSVLGGLTIGMLAFIVIRGWRLANRLRQAAS